MTRPLLVLICFASLLPAQDVKDIVNRFIEAEKANEAKARNYTFTETISHYERDKRGNLKPAGEEVNEVLFVEGESYKKLVSRNGEPLPAKEQAQQEKKMKQTAAERRKARRNGLFHREQNLGTFEDLRTLYDCRISGEETVRDRKVWILEATPKTTHKPANDHEKQAMSFRKKFWIDQAEFVEVRETDSVVDDKSILKPGTVIQIEFEKIQEDTWLMTSLDMDYRIQILKMLGDTGHQEQRYANFKKFDVQSTITVDEVK